MRKSRKLLLILFMVFTANIHVFAADVSDQIPNAPRVDEKVLNEILEESIVSGVNYRNSLKKAGVKEYTVTASYSSMPARYDGREKGTVTPVKNQLPYGLCWSYASVATAESSLMKSGHADNTIDLSELQYGYVQWKNKYPEDDYSSAFNAGGTIVDVWNYMRKGIGPYYEENFGTPQDYAGDEFSDELINSHLYDFESMYYAVPGIGGRAVKNLIMQYGGVSAVYYSSNKYYKADPVASGESNYDNTGDTSYYYPADISMINHMVEIVGWDDNYPKENFAKTPSGDGAWLVKNSWGEQYLGDFPDNLEEYLNNHEEDLAAPTGYYWISYYDGSIDGNPMVAVSFADADTMPREITVKGAKEIMRPGDTYSITTTVLPDTARNKEVTYSSSDSKIVEVSDDGVITAKSTGTAVITIATKQIYDNVTGDPYVVKELNITVSDLYFCEDAAYLNNFTKTKLIWKAIGIEDVTFSSSDESIVTVDDTGTITPHQYGKATITIQGGSFSDQMDVYVYLDHLDDYSLTVGYIKGLKYHLLPSVEGTVPNIPFQLSSEDDAVIDGEFISFDSDWFKTVTITCQDEIYTLGKEITGTVTMCLSEPDVNIPTSLALSPNEIYDLSIGNFPPMSNVDEFVPEDVIQDNTPVISGAHYSSSDENVVFMDNDGIAHARGSGTATVTYQRTITQNNASQVEQYTCNITVKEWGSWIDKPFPSYTPQNTDVAKSENAAPVEIKSITLSKEQYTYTGKKITPEVSVMLSDGTMSKDYTVTYQKNKKIGTASAIIHFKGELDGFQDKTLYFTIVPQKSRITGKSGLIRAKKIKGVTGYEFQFALDKNFTKSKSVKRVKTTVISKKSGARYVRVRTYKTVKGKRYYSAWSAAKKM